MGLFSRRNEVRADDIPEPSITEEDRSGENLLISKLDDRECITKAEALNVPACAACVNIIAGTISGVPVKFYRDGDEQDDQRLRLLNSDTGDTLTSVDFWRAMVSDYLLDKGGYAYINRDFNTVKSLHYVEAENVGIMRNNDHIFKQYDILVDAKRYHSFNFLKIYRKTRMGTKGISLLEDSPLPFRTALNTLKFQNGLVKRGGNKRGFLKSKNHLSTDAFNALKRAFRLLYNNSDTEDNVIVLNDGVDFQEASTTSVEMQLAESQKKDKENICNIFSVPVSILDGNATPEDINSFIRFCIMPILTDIEASLNRDLLTEEEKANCYFAFDTSRLLRGDLKSRYEAYEIGIRNRFLQSDEVRQMEDMEPMGFDYITLGLDQVFYDPQTDTVYTPNTGTKTKMKGGEGDGKD